MTQRQLEIAKTILRFLVVSNGKGSLENCYSFISLNTDYKRDEFSDILILLEKHSLINLHKEDKEEIIYLTPNGYMAAGKGLGNYLELKQEDLKKGKGNFWIYLILLFILLIVIISYLYLKFKS